MDSAAAATPFVAFRAAFAFAGSDWHFLAAIACIVGVAGVVIGWN